MHLGKHVYCEKPLAASVGEARFMRELAAEKKLVTQMGTQIHAGENYRRAVEIVQSGALGKVNRVQVWIGSKPLYLARDLGQLDPRVVQLVEYPSSSEVLRAFRNEAIDGMVVSLDELFGLAIDGLKPRIVLVTDLSHGADAVVGRQGMSSMHDLKGKRVAVESGALGAYVLSRALALSGMRAAVAAPGAGSRGPQLADPVLDRADRQHTDHELDHGPGGG